MGEIQAKWYQKNKNNPDFQKKRSEYQKQYNLKNKSYVRDRRKKYNQRPEVRERHRIEESLRRESKRQQINLQNKMRYHDNHTLRESMIDYSRWYRKTHKSEIKEKDQKRKRELKIEVLSYYSKGSPKCACCGEDILQFLTLDHIKGGGNIHRTKLGKSGLNFYSWIKKIGFPNYLRVLCMNCNFGSRMNNGICPHKM